MRAKDLTTGLTVAAICAALGISLGFAGSSNSNNDVASPEEGREDFLLDTNDYLQSFRDSDTEELGYWKLANGETAGVPFFDTHPDDYPDFYPVTLADGSEAYLKVQEAFGEFFLDPIDTEDAGAETYEQVRIPVPQPNKDGEVWVPAYAADGETIVGQFLLVHHLEE